MNIILIGFMGAGKTSVGKQLAKNLHYSWIDTDEIAIQKAKKETMEELFSLGGELLLREMEIEIAKEYSFKQNLIVSTGGGVIQNKIILDYFKQGGGRVVFLKAEFNTLVKRLEKDLSRPLFKEISSAQKLYEFRLPLYLQYADIVVEVDPFSIEEMALKIEEGVFCGL